MDLAAQFQTFDLISPVISFKTTARPLRFQRGLIASGDRRPAFACSMVSAKLPRKLLSEGIHHDLPLGPSAWHSMATSTCFNFPIFLGFTFTFDDFGLGWFRGPTLNQRALQPP